MGQRGFWDEEKRIHRLQQKKPGDFSAPVRDAAYIVYNCELSGALHVQFLL
jgi:hypothetical protein